MQDSQIVRMELKYCECCGGLLLRAAGTEAIYCAGCAARVRELAPPRTRRSRARGPALPQAQAGATSCEVVEEIHAVAALSYESCRVGVAPALAGPQFRGDARYPAQAIGHEEQETWRTA